MTTTLAILFVALGSLSAAAAPLKGIVLWAGQAKARPDLSSAVSLEFAYCRPCDVAVGTNSVGAVVYDWSGFDSLLSAAASRGHQMIVRARPLPNLLRRAWRSVSSTTASCAGSTTSQTARAEG